MNQLGVILLAAGQGTRMKSAVPKVLHSLGGKALYLHVLETAKRLDPAVVAIVVGHAARTVQEACPFSDVNWAVQEEQLGTGHAVLSAHDKFRAFEGDILILSGDVPLIQEQTLRMMIEHQRSSRADLSFLTAQLDNPNGYGRILRNAEGAVAGIVEEKDATGEQRQISEVNTGVYVVSSPFLFEALAAVKNHNQQKEYYLTDIVAIALRQKKKVEAVHVDDVRETLGINSREDLAKMEKNLRDKINQKWM
ncbi:MAG: NTP transferase domain-containing protein, partial [Candidatus Binatia bacterium]